MLYLEPLQMPENVEYDRETYSPHYGRFEIGPLEPGFGTTIGNTLRGVAYPRSRARLYALSASKVCTTNSRRFPEPIRTTST